MSLSYKKYVTQKVRQHFISLRYFELVLFQQSTLTVAEPPTYSSWLNK